MCDFLDSLEGLDLSSKRTGDTIALIFHAYMLSLDFRLTGLADEKPVAGGTV